MGANGEKRIEKSCKTEMEGCFVLIFYLIFFKFLMKTHEAEREKGVGVLRYKWEETEQRAVWNGSAWDSKTEEGHW